MGKKKKKETVLQDENKLQKVSPCSKTYEPFGFNPT